MQHNEPLIEMCYVISTHVLLCNVSNNIAASPDNAANLESSVVLGFIGERAIPLYDLDGVKV